MNKNQSAYSDEAASAVEFDDFSLAEFSADGSNADAEKESSAGYRILAVLFFLLAAGGLFIGMLSKWVSFFTPIMTGGTNIEILNLSHLGYVITLFKDAFFPYGTFTFEFITQTFEMSTSAGVAVIAELLLGALTVIAAVLSLILMIVSLASGKAAKKCAVASGVVTLIAYGGTFAFAFYALSLELTIANIMDSVVADTYNVFRAELFDVCTGIIAGAVLLLLVIAALARGKGYGLYNILLFLLALGAGLALVYPCSVLILYVSIAFDFETGIFFGISLLALVILVAFNIFVCMIRLGAKKGKKEDGVKIGPFVFDLVRFALQAVAAVLTSIAFIKEFEDYSLVEGMQLVPSILLWCATGVAFLASLIAVILKTVKKRKSAQEETAETPVSAEDAEAVPVVTDAYTDRDDFSSEKTPYGFADKTQSDYEEPVTTAYVAEEAHYSPVSERSAPEPTEFERRMEAIARNASIADAPAPSPAAPVYTAPAAMAPQMRSVPQPQPQPQSSFYADPSQYTYDAFIASLTPQEKNEFGDVFIANKFGTQSYLPQYVIGGNNREFFSKVFIYLGRYRTYVSAGLLDKIYVYVSKGLSQ